ncbi:CRISPR-associated endonuclease Cas2 [Candidatus Kaiserbacteria bacterium]|nr:CRISPR-associated endonuclease Cas2 [Candidatus Kaiserbacteria bacterium]
MGKVEAEASKKRQKAYIQVALLTAVALAGVALVASVAPNLPVALDKLPSVKRARLRYQYRTSLGRLAVQGYIKFEKRDGKSYARITEAGRKKLAFEQEKAKLDLSKRRRWNGSWRVVIFDIPERRRRTRNRLRIIMQELGFVRLQDSVWVFPYDCEDFVALLKAELKIGGAVLYMVVEAIENDRHLREHFGL